MTATAVNVALKRRQLARMRAAGLRVLEVDGWEKRGRPATYAPIAVMEHHDASTWRSGNAGALGIIIAGRPGISGPLSQWQVGRDGTWFLVAAGRANHAGAGGPILDIPEDSGNRYVEGVEVANDGVSETYSPQLQRSLDVGLACLLAEIRQSLTGQVVDFLLGHKTWTPRKSDPRHQMPWRRDRVRAVLARWTTPPDPTPIQEDDMKPIVFIHGTGWWFSAGPRRTVPVPSMDHVRNLRALGAHDARQPIVDDDGNAKEISPAFLDWLVSLEPAGAGQ